MLLLFIGIVRPVEFISPSTIPLFLTTILFDASNSKLVVDVKLETPTPFISRPSVVTYPPTNKFFTMPAPPATVNAPVLPLVVSVADVTVKVPNNPVPSSIFNVPIIPAVCEP